MINAQRRSQERLRSGKRILSGERMEAGLKRLSEVVGKVDGRDLWGLSR